jgi:predicted TIM-barrel fold metal-dependent hydrolase
MDFNTAPGAWSTLLAATRVAAATGGDEAMQHGASALPIFDADNHYYETRDCCTRHIDPLGRAKAVRYELRDGRYLIFAGERLYTYGAVYVDHCGTPGSLVRFLRSLKSGVEGMHSEGDQPMQPEYQVRDRRLALMDRQGVEAALLLPSLGVTIEHFMKHDVEQTCANLRAFNRWLDEDWGFAYRGRIFAVPLLSLLDLDWAVKELDWLLARGARAVHLRPGPQGRRSPADVTFDPFWARIDEARIPIVFHSSESGYNELYSTAWGEQPNPAPYEQSAWQWMNTFGDRPILDTLTSLIYWNLFDRFPNVRVASIENGSLWVRYLLDSIDKKKGMGRNGPWPGGRLRRKPSEIFRERVFLTPFPEDDVMGLIELVGAGQVLCGSDFPHPEGMSEPRAFFDLVKDLEPGSLRRVMRDNARGLLGLGS